MQKVQYNSGSSGNSSIEGQNRSANKTSRQTPAQIIQQANNKKKLLSVLQAYDIKLIGNDFTEWSDHIVCPFPSHKGGKERTGSFGYNFKKDYFNCFGCGKFGRAVEFIAFKESIDKLVVAEQILKEFGSDNSDQQFEDENPKIEALLFDFSKFVQLIFQKHKENQDVLDQVDKVIWWFDNYLVAKVPKNKIFVEELGERILKAKDLLKDYSD